METDTIETTTTAAQQTIAPPTRDEEIVEMYAQGIAIQDICVEFAISPPTLYYTLRRMGVRINRKKAHPIETKVPAPTPTSTSTPVSTLHAVGRPPNPSFTPDVQKVLLKDFEIFGSARKVAALNRLSYWGVLKFFRKQGVPLTVGSKHAHALLDLVGNTLSRERIEEIRLAYERLSLDASVSFEDFAAEYGISVATLVTVTTAASASSAAAMKAATTAELQRYPAEVVAGMMKEVEARLRTKMEADYQPALPGVDV